MIKEGQDMSYYSGRDYDQVCTAYLRLLQEKEELKSKLIRRLTDTLTPQDNTTAQKIVIAVNEIMS